MHISGGNFLPRGDILSKDPEDFFIIAQNILQALSRRVDIIVDDSVWHKIILRNFSNDSFDFSLIFLVRSRTFFMKKIPNLFFIGQIDIASRSVCV